MQRLKFDPPKGGILSPEFIKTEKNRYSAALAKDTRGCILCENPPLIHFPEKRLAFFDGFISFLKTILGFEFNPAGQNESITWTTTATGFFAIRILGFQGAFSTTATYTITRTQ